MWNIGFPAGGRVAGTDRRDHATSGKFFVVFHRACQPLNRSKADGRKASGAPLFFDTGHLTLPGSVMLVSRLKAALVATTVPSH